MKRQTVFAENNWSLTVSFDKGDILDGLNCLKLRCMLQPEGYEPKYASTYYLWLATERNFIPVKYEAYSARYHSDLPVEIGHVEEFREISAGLWIPFHYSLRIYDAGSLQQGKVVVGNSEEYVVEKASLNPSYDLSLFRDIHIPRGMAVYVVKDGKIIESYAEGEPRRRASFVRSWRGAVVGVIFLSGTLVASVAFVRRRCRRPRVETPVESSGHTRV